MIKKEAKVIDNSKLFSTYLKTEITDVKSLGLPETCKCKIYISQLINRARLFKKGLTSI